MEIFDKNSLKTLIEEYKVPMFNHDYISRRLNILEYYFLDKPLTIMSYDGQHKLQRVVCLARQGA